MKYQQQKKFLSNNVSGQVQNSKASKTHRKDVRSAAFEILRRIWKSPDDNVPLPVLLKESSEQYCFSSQDSAFFSALVYAVLRHYAFTDEKTAVYCSHANSLSSAISLLLRMGIAELFFLRTPPHAVVNEYVQKTRRFGKTMTGLVNGVLRRASSECGECSFQAENQKAGEAFSVPLWIFNLWQEQYGQEKAEQYAQSTLYAPVPCWRINALKNDSLPFREAWLNKGFLPVGKHGFSFPDEHVEPKEKHQYLMELSQLEEQGRISRQGMASQLASEKIAEILYSMTRKDRFSLWDACCGRGGKSISLLEKGIPVQCASDPSFLRMEEMKKELCRLGLPFPEMHCSPAQDIQGEFSAIILDAPCSGTGTLGRNPELKFRITPEKLDNAAVLQKELLEHAWHCLDRDGVLFYLTCALNRMENEEIIRQFLSKHSAELEYEQLFDQVPFGQDVLYLAALRNTAR